MKSKRGTEGQKRKNEERKKRIKEVSEIGRQR